MSEGKILVVEDDKQFATFITTFLAKRGYEVTTVYDGAGFFKAEANETFDCIALDLTLPDEDGIVLARKLRARNETPIIIMTGRDGLDDKLASFDVGADDYITKPFDPRELHARIQAVIRRLGPDDAEHDKNIVKAGSITLDRKRMEVTNGAGEQVSFTGGEFSMLWAIVHGNGEVLDRPALIDAVSSGDGPETDRAVDILISRIRKKIGKDAIKTVAGSGYKMGDGLK